KIFKSAPSLDGLTELDPNAGGSVYISALISGSIVLGNVLTLSGFVAITLEGGAQTLVRISGAVSTNIPFFGALSGSIDLIFYGDRGDSGTSGVPNPGIVGRVTLGFQSSSSGLTPGAQWLNVEALLEVNLFVFNNH